MNYGELKAAIRNLGFSDDSEIEEFGEIVSSSINRAITEINLTISPIVDSYEIVQDGMVDGVVYYNIEELTKENGIVRFLDFAHVPVMVGDGIYRKFNDYEIEGGNTIVMDGTVKGTFKIFYKKDHSAITLDTPDETELELPLKAHILVPLLSSYYIWLEDEKAKAVDYYNQYEKLSQEITKTDPRIRIMSGGM